MTHQSSVRFEEYLDEEAREMIVDLMEGDQEMIIDLIDTLNDSNPTLLEQLVLGVSAQDAVQIREAAHALKSSNAQLGALNFSGLCQQMEEVGKRSQLGDASYLLELIKEEYQKVSVALESWKSSLA